MAQSIKKRMAAMSSKKDAEELRKVLDAVLTDLTAIRTSVTTLTAKCDVLTAKLNADAGVTDANYATDFAATCDPAALTTTS